MAFSFSSTVTCLNSYLSLGRSNGFLLVLFLKAPSHCPFPLTSLHLKPLFFLTSSHQCHSLIPLLLASYTVFLDVMSKILLFLYTLSWQFSSCHGSDDFLYMNDSQFHPFLWPLSWALISQDSSTEGPASLEALLPRAHHIYSQLLSLNDMTILVLSSCSFFLFSPVATALFKPVTFF